VSRTGRAVTVAEVQRWRDLYRRGWSTTRIARHAKRARSTVWVHLRDVVAAQRVRFRTGEEIARSYTVQRCRRSRVVSITLPASWPWRVHTAEVRWVVHGATLEGFLSPGEVDE
jgi:hypothetical protein